jgi:hypothetical protein
VIPYGAQDVIEECRAIGPGEPIAFEAGVSLRRAVKPRNKRISTTLEIAASTDSAGFSLRNSSATA